MKELHIVPENENAFIASAPTFHRDMSRKGFPSVKFEVTIQNFPSFFSSEKKKIITKTVEIPFEKFRSIDIASIDELPYRKYLMVLRDENKKAFVSEVIQFVIRPNEFVKEIKLNNFKAGILIYDSKIQQVLQGNHSTIFSIPAEKNKKEIYSSSELTNFFDLSFSDHKLTNWSDVNSRKSLLREKIGFTVQSQKKGIKGYEVKVWVDYPDLKQDKYFVFIEDLKVVRVKDKETDKLYYIHSPEIKERLMNIYTILATQHPGYRNIGIGWLFFNEVVEFKNDSKNYKDFESKLYRRVRYDFKEGEGFERIEVKKDNEKFWGLNKYSEIEFTESHVVYFDDEIDSFADDFNDKNFRGDLESDFYSNLF